MALKPFQLVLARYILKDHTFLGLGSIPLFLFCPWSTHHPSGTPHLHLKRKIVNPRTQLIASGQHLIYGVDAEDRFELLSVQ